MSEEQDTSVTLNINRLKGRTLAERYRLERHIDRGGFGAVYEATDLKFDSTVAIKVADSSAMSSEAEFRKEAKLARKFEHPNVVRVYDYGIDNNLPFIVMEFLKGPRLDQLLTRYQRRLPDDKLYKFVNEMGSALQNAHAQYLVHRDLKPNNIILVDEGKSSERFVLLDFGIAAQIDTTSTVRNATSDGAGTPEYMSPEQITAKQGDPPVTAASDIYSFGVITFLLLAGHVPFPLKDSSYLAISECFQKILKEQSPEISIDAAGNPVDPEIELAIRQCLEKRSEDRPESMRHVQDRIVDALLPKLTTDSTSVPDSIRNQLQPISSFAPTMISEDVSSAADASTKNMSQTDPNAATAGWRKGHETGASSSKAKLVAGLASVLGAIVVGAVCLHWVIDHPATDTNKNHNGSSAGTGKNGNDKKPGKKNGRAVPAVTMPENCKPGENAKVITADGKRLYDRIILTTKDEHLVELLLIHEEDAITSGVRPRPFYMMQDKVTNDLFAEFAAAEPEAIQVDEDQKPKWEHGAQKGIVSVGVSNVRLPVFNVSVDEAHQFAVWLAGTSGHLPTVEQWKLAAGFYRWKNQKLESPWEVGPYQGNWNSEEPLQISIDRAAKGPLEAGVSQHDISPTGCRDMAGNGVELTSDLGLGGTVPVESPSEEHSVHKLGHSYDDDVPLSYEEMDERISISFQDYTSRAPSVSFRVVIEVN